MAMVTEISNNNQYTIGDIFSPSSLTGREVEILSQMARGLDNQGIADQLSLQLQTVKNHSSHVLSKLQADNRTHAVILGLQRGLIELPLPGLGSLRSQIA
jgi:DNA-binding NarL/FixJ family response regulator